MIDDRPIGEREVDALRLQEAARAAWVAEYAVDRKWSLWMRLSWASSVSEAVAVMQVEEWAERLMKRIRGAYVLVGIHDDTGRRHAHALVHVPRGSAPPNPPPCAWLPGVAQAWHQSLWPHGVIWLDRFRPKKSAGDEAAFYAARNPGSVMAFGIMPKR